jgi:antitoxin (DNA-binding transcriptional repressor) of toxin-antitoxin stability system
MRLVGLKALKSKLSTYARLAARGETVLVIDHDRVVADVVPPRAGRSPPITDAPLPEAVRNGWLTPPASPGRSPPPCKPVTASRELMQELQRDRDDR